ncbi:putative retrotransposon hot spot (RHS) protein [Trypanosoma cruzi]|uniref:Retrotransposon hot spot (RHS) protein, putative n=2 Tax=Trypanosoma cruzi TaxID=5693 RepID=Q4DKD3_TRYCC|nr:retrotransposon hot spot (RHS) protein, putative [Trypanosoma cruzi]EAN92986.1 retrotransposon hot spot (RHS) protein, putative [Trypanosoma cruzi]PWV04268.1 putative retrotransposon hot spot (RHS) protein [Trypanosoma cruzi]|eukprot:XP_814837.1 retrotransposon hot spot (RHS) protein [Trypanosoma cruzi strain CL Brener]
MPPKRNRVQGGNAKSRASAAPRVGLQRRARPESEGETDQPAATHIRVEERQQPQWTMSSTVKDVLREGSTNRTDMRLNDFLTMELDGRGALDANRDVLLEEVFKDPKKYIRDAGVLNEMQASDRYKRMERAARDEMDMAEDADKLYNKGMYNLLGWPLATPEVKASAHGATKSFLDAAAEEAWNPMTTIAPMYLEGLYESVYNARWHHVVEVRGGEGTGMRVEVGKPEQSWTYKAVGNTLEKDDAVQQSGAARLRLMVLTSDKGWPYTLNGPHRCGNDLCVNCEVDRVWQIVKGDLNKWLSNSDLTLNPSPLFRLLIGTPGIGKSMAASSYLLYQLLQYDVEKLPAVVHCFGTAMYVFDKTAKTVKKYNGEITSRNLLYGLRRSGMKGYIIYDVETQGTQPDPGFAPSTGWGMILVSSPEVSNYDGWEEQLKVSRIIMNCPDETDVKAMCAWMKRDETKKKQAECWRMVEERMEKVGPIIRHIFDAVEYEKRTKDVLRTLRWFNMGDRGKYFTQGGENEWHSEGPSQKLLKVVRVREYGPIEDFANAPICVYLGVLTVSRLAKVLSPHDILFLVLGMKNAVQSADLKKYALSVFLNEGFVTSMVKDLKELPPPSPSKPRPSVLTLNPHGYPTEAAAITELNLIDGLQKLKRRLLYIPTSPTFPLVDCFFFMESPRRTLVGLRMTTASAHHTTASTVRQFTERLAAYFEGWEEFSQGLSWEMIYVQHADSTPMNDWQGCDCVNPNNKIDAEKKIVAFWDGKVHQYRVMLKGKFPEEIKFSDDSLPEGDKKNRKI